MEYRLRCNVCGKVWCFSDEDLKKNQGNAALSGLAALGGIAAALGGTTAQQHLNYDMSQRAASKVVNYWKCPSCNSEDYSALSQEEWEASQQKTEFSRAAVSVNANATPEALLRRAELFLTDRDWASANAYCDHVLDAQPENARAYLLKLMAELKVEEPEGLGELSKPFDDRPTYKKLLRFADEATRKTVEGYLQRINHRIREERLEQLYTSALAAMESASADQDLERAAGLFQEVGAYRDAPARLHQCREQIRQNRQRALEEQALAAQKAKRAKKAALILVPVLLVLIAAAIPLSQMMRRSADYQTALDYAAQGDYSEALDLFYQLVDYKDSREQIAAILEARYNTAMEYARQGDYENARSIFEALSRDAVLGDYKDSSQLVEQLDREYDALEDLRTALKEGGTTLDDTSAQGSWDIDAMLAAEENQFLTLSQEELDFLALIKPFYGPRWAFSQGDDTVLSLASSGASQGGTTDSYWTSADLDGQSLLLHCSVYFYQERDGRYVSIKEELRFKDDGQGNLCNEALDGVFTLTSPAPGVTRIHWAGEDGTTLSAEYANTL